MRATDLPLQSSTNTSTYDEPAGVADLSSTNVDPSARNAVIVLRNSPIHGTGCFASTKINAGNILGEYCGEIINEAEAWRRDDHNCPDYSPYIVHLDGEWFVDGAVGGGDMKYLNHSCNPNCCVIRFAGRIFIVAARDVPELDELTIDYALDNGPDFVCLCNAQSCRGTPQPVGRIDL